MIESQMSQWFNTLTLKLDFKISIDIFNIRIKKQFEIFGNTHELFLSRVTQDKRGD